MTLDTTNPAYFAKSSHRSNGTHRFKSSLAVEAANMYRVEQLFSDVEITDIAGSVKERRTGTDTLVHLPQADGVKTVRVEHKFEQYPSGRITFELCSVDRGPSFRAGWFFTSQAAWLLSWFPSGDLLVCKLDELRQVVLANPARNQSTTTKNASYLSWNVLEDINFILNNVKNAYVVNTRTALGESPQYPSKVFGSASKKFITPAEMLVIMNSHPASSTPIDVTPEQVYDYCRQLVGVNRMAKQHDRVIRLLPWINHI